MPMKDRTKELFADALRNMMMTVPLKKIRVKDLCEYCGVERQTFYYHFKDKYFLAAWIYLQDITAWAAEGSIPFGEEYLAGILRRIKTNFAFYRKVFSDQSQNSLWKFFRNHQLSQEIAIVKEYLSVDTLDTETTYVIKSYVFASVGHTMEWFEKKTDYSPEEFAHLLYINMPDILKAALRERRMRRTKG